MLSHSPSTSLKEWAISVLTMTLLETRCVFMYGGTFCILENMYILYFLELYPGYYPFELQLCFSFHPVKNFLPDGVQQNSVIEGRLWKELTPSENVDFFV